MNLSKLIHALESAFLWTLETSLYATVLIALVFAVQFCFRKVLAPRWRYALSLLVVLRLALPIVPQSSWSIFNLFRNEQPVADVVAVPTPQPTIVELPDAAALEASNPAITPAETITPVPVRREFRFGPLLKFIWLAGFVAMLAIVARQHRRFVFESRRWGAVTDPRVLGLLDECRNVIGVRRPLKMLEARDLNTPALFGFWRPRLLMPQELVVRLTDQELRHVFLHELLHLRRGDVLVNWAMIFLRAMHWFNPAVWLAFRRLRADQELACDAAVMAHLDAPERRHYGATLIKLLEDFSAQALCPGVVPFVTNKQVIKRRISMIAEFKPAGRLTMLGSFAIVGLLGIVTFTRASQGPGARETPGELPSAAPTPAGNQTQASDGAAQAFVKAMRDQDDRIRAQEQKVNALRANLHVQDSASSSTGPESSNPQAAALMQLSAILIQAENDANKQEMMLAQLRRLDHNQLRMTLPRLIPDTILSQLLQNLLTVDTQLSYQLASMGAEHPDVKKNAELKGKLEAQIKEQVAAIMRAQEVAVETSRAQARNIEKQIAEMKARESESLEASRPYWEAKAELDRMRRMREVVDMRRAQEQMDFQTSSKTVNDLSPTMLGVPTDVLTRYRDAQNLLVQAHRAFKKQQLSVPEGSPLLTPYQRRVEQFEQEVAGFEKAYPQLTAIGVPGAGGMPGSAGQTSAAALRVVVRSDGTMRLGSSADPVTLEQFNAAFAKEHEKNPQVGLILSSDSSVSYSAIIDILDAAKKAGISSISLQTLSNLK